MVGQNQFIERAIVDSYTLNTWERKGKQPVVYISLANSRLPLLNNIMCGFCSLIWNRISLNWSQNGHLWTYITLYGCISSKMSSKLQGPNPHPFSFGKHYQSAALETMRSQYLPDDDEFRISIRHETTSYVPESKHHNTDIRKTWRLILM